MKNSSHLNIGKNKKIAFVFSCPGQKEDENEKPIFGSTGNNLEKILRNLDIDFKDRYDFRITNASVEVNYKEKTGRTESLSLNILNKTNIERLTNELQDIENYIIFFGEKAKSTSIYLTGLKAKFIFCQHLGLNSINQIKLELTKYKNNKPVENTKNRLEIISELIKKQM